MKQNKKAVAGFTPWIIGGVVLVAIIIFVGFSKGAFASKVITSASKTTEGCKPENIPVSIKGIAYTKDVAFWGVIAEPDKIEINQVTAGGIGLRAVSTQDFSWSVKLYDDYTRCRV